MGVGGKRRYPYQLRDWRGSVLSGGLKPTEPWTMSRILKVSGAIGEKGFIV